jgi:hypothetical protein
MRSDKSGVMPMVVPATTTTSKPKRNCSGQVRAVSRLKHYSIRTERAYTDWIRRLFVFFPAPDKEKRARAVARKNYCPFANPL